jgi:predicted RecB family nuclease
MYKNGELWSFNTRDLMRASTCDHCTTLSVLHALEDESTEVKLHLYIERQQRDRAEGQNKSLPQRYGDEFEAQLTRELSSHLNSSEFRKPETEGDINQTLELMMMKTPVIYQGGLEHATEETVFKGRPDFLVLNGWGLFFEKGELRAKQVEENFGHGYKVWDAKYSSHPKPEYALQVAIYIEALKRISFLAEGEDHGLILGNRSLYQLKEAEILPAARLARAELEKSIRKVVSSDRSELLDKFAWHCAGTKQCEICEYPELCKDDRKATSDLLLVAGLGQTMRAKLMTARINTMRELADSALDKVPDVSAQTFEKLKLQANIQVKGDVSFRPEHELLANPMLQYLPKPDPADVFFDMEGFPYFRDGGLEYLFGNWTKDVGFVEFWATDRKSEREAFKEFMSWLHQRMMDNPNAHVYHYASYERTALKKLANRFALMEEELLQLESQLRFVDLYPIVTKSIRVSEPRYSIKNLERHYGFERESKVETASDSIDGYADWRDLEEQLSSGNPIENRGEKEERAKEIYNALRKYNMEDVQSTMYLYEWLLLFNGAATLPWESVFFRPEAEESKELNDRQLKLLELEAITAFLFDPISTYEKGSDPKLDLQVSAWEALAHSILFYQRESVMFWADLNVRMSMDDEEITQDRKAMVVSDATTLGDEGGLIAAGSAVYSVSVPEDEFFRPDAGDSIAIRYEVAPGLVRWDFGNVLSNEAGELVFERKPKDPQNLKYRPSAIFDATTYNTSGKQHFLNQTAREITADWGNPFQEPPYGYPVLDILLRRTPRLMGSRELLEADPNDYLPALINAAERLNRGAMAVQGPPGTGKTYLASRLIKHLVEKGKRVAVGTNSHAAVENVLNDCISAGMPKEQVFKVRDKDDKSDKAWTAFNSADTLATGLKRNPGPLVMGGTSFALCNKKVREFKFDYLIIDEAAQYSLVDLIAASGIAQNIILFGDPQQLSQVVQAVHPGGVANSALGHFIGENSILPRELGYFVQLTRRMHPELTKAVSWLAYEGRLGSFEKTKLNVLDNVSPGLHTIELNHTGNSTYSPEEVETVIDIVGSHISKVGPSEILIVAPYNNQVNAIRRALDAAGYHEVRVGTVDKFQGQEGMVVIVSLACSSADDAPRGLDFLLDRNRLNVAISRGKSVCYAIYSSHLLSASFRTIEDVRSVSRLAGLKDLRVN